MKKSSSNAVEIYFKGYPICKGIAIGKPFFFTTPEEKIPEFSVPDHEIDNEVKRYQNALNSSQDDLLSLQKRLQNEGGVEAAAILSSHLEIIHDPLITIKVEEAIRTKGKNTEFVFKSVIREYEQKFSKITDAFFRERLKDFQDISRRIIGHLRQRKKISLSAVQNRSIIFAHELSPSDTAEANADFIEAFVTRSGAETSHVAIMARAKGIPFVSSVNFPDLSVALPTLVVVNGTSGEVVFNPSKETLNYYKKEQKKIKVFIKSIEKEAEFKTETFDGFQPTLTANIDMIEEISLLQKYGGDGIGLFRSEYLFLEKGVFPSEEEQFLIYKGIIEKINGAPVIIRTFDIGGDKLSDDFPYKFEQNPFLGCRGIRLMLKEKALFKNQLKAILRASAFGQVSLLLPMISSLSEIKGTKVLLKEAQDELKASSIPFSRTIPLGCMIEVPSAAMTCDILANECDFFSIGTNDLVQYAMAVDRTSPAMSYLYKATHPGVLRLLKMIVKTCIKASKPVSICGEIAADPKFTPLLLGLGIYQLSVSSAQLPGIKNMIRRLSIIDATFFANELLLMRSAEEVQMELDRFYSQTS